MRRTAPRSGGAGRFHAVLALLLALSWSAPGATQAPGADPLPSWNDGPAKRAVVAFVQRATTPGGPDFVPVEERVATFDNDGTLWAEKPLPVEVYFVLSRLRELAEGDPSLRSTQPFRAALEGDAAYFHEAGAEAVAKLLLKTHSGTTQEEFAAEARRFLAEARHPDLDRPIAGVVYQPMLELLAYLRASGFRTWICSGGTLDFVRVFAPEAYGVPPEQTIGSELKREPRVAGGRLVLVRQPQVEHLNDKEGKPVGIDRHIGRRPAFVAGNVLSGGDIAMMRYSKGRSGPSFQLLVNHDDPAREFAYAERDSASLRAARQFGFTVVSIRRDWRQVFPDPPGRTAAGVRAAPASARGPSASGRQNRPRRASAPVRSLSRPHP